jgi:hypothetical protein
MKYSRKLKTKNIRYKSRNKRKFNHKGGSVPGTQPISLSKLKNIYKPSDVVRDYKTEYKLVDFMAAFNLRELVDGGFTISELKNSSSKFSLKNFDIKQFKIHELIGDDKFTFEDVRDYLLSKYSSKDYYSKLKEMFDWGVPIDELKQVATLDDFIKSDFSIRELWVENGFKLEEFIVYMRKNNYHILKKMIDDGFTIDDLNRVGVTLRDYWNARQQKKRSDPTAMIKYFTVTELKNYGFTITDFKQQYDAYFPNCYDLRDMTGFYDADCAFTISELKAAGFTLENFKNDNCRVNDLMGGFGVYEFVLDFLKNIDAKGDVKVEGVKKFFNLQDLVEGGISIAELKSYNNIPIKCFLREFLNKQEILIGNDKFTSSELINTLKKEFNYTVYALFKAGYTYGEIRHLYKLQDNAPQKDIDLDKLNKLLDNCDKTHGHKDINCTYKQVMNK